MTERDVQILFTVSGDRTISKIILEPWAEELKISNGQKIDIRAKGPADQISIEIGVRDGALVIWGWTGSILEFS